MWYILDILEYSVRGILLLYLCSDAFVWKKKYTKQGKYLFFLLFVVWGFWLGNSKWLKRLLYGENAEIQKSSTSIIKLLLMMAVCFLLLNFFYEGSRLMKAYMTLLFETVLEMARFGIHCFWSLGINVFCDWLVRKTLEDTMQIERFYLIIKNAEYIWNLSFVLLYSGILYLTIRLIRKYRQNMRDISRQGILFLMISPAIGMAFDLVMRCLFFTRTGEQIDFLYDRHKGMYAIIPVMTFLCLLSIIYSIKIYEELMRTQEEKSRMLFYEQQLADMTGHVREMERLYDGIRGINHDMNNYIADMEQLLGASLKQGDLNDSIESEAQKYLEHMKSALDTMTIRYSTGNPVMDVIMNRKWQECEKEGIRLTSDFLYPEQLGIEAFDLGILMNNALDNAIEACKNCIRKKELNIRVHSYLKGRMFFLRIENDCDGTKVLYTEDEMLRTTKEDDRIHGVGLKNMRSVADRYFGTMTYEINDDVFILTIMLQGSNS